jgi:hypothetical protein
MLTVAAVMMLSTNFVYAAEKFSVVRIGVEAKSCEAALSFFDLDPSSHSISSKLLFGKFSQIKDLLSKAGYPLFRINELLDTFRDFKDDPSPFGDGIRAIRGLSDDELGLIFCAYTGSCRLKNVATPVAAAYVPSVNGAGYHGESLGYVITKDGLQGSPSPHYIFLDYTNQVDDLSLKLPLRRKSAFFHEAMHLADWIRINKWIKANLQKINLGLKPDDLFTLATSKINTDTYLLSGLFVTIYLEGIAFQFQSHELKINHPFAPVTTSQTVSGDFVLSVLEYNYKDPILKELRRLGITGSNIFQKALEWRSLMNAAAKTT